MLDALRGVRGVEDVHDLHVWSLTSGMNVATAHLVLTDDADGDAVLRAAQTVLRDSHGIEHATLQVETDARRCAELSW